MNESTSLSRTPAKWNDRLKKLNEFLAHIGPLLGAIPGVFLLWIVAGPVLRSHKFSPTAILSLAFVACGILLVGAFLGAILGCLTFIVQRLSPDNAASFAPSAPAPAIAPAKTRPHLILSLVAALVFFFVGFAGGTIWTLHCVYVIKLSDAAVNTLGINGGSLPPLPQFPTHH